MPDQTVERRLLSGSTDGKQIKVAATATPGTLLHTASATAGITDWVTLYAVNDDTSDILLTIEWGGTTSPDDLKRQTILTRGGDALVVASLPIQNGLVVRAFAGTANKILVSGFVERVTTQ